MNLSSTDRIKFALPTKGRLKDPAIDILKKAGFKFRTVGRNLYATCTNAEIVFIFVRADDIPVLVDSGTIDVGITGSDLIVERNAAVEKIMPLGFGKCRLCVAVPDTHEGDDHSFFEGKTIATSFPHMTESFFRGKNVAVKSVEMNGSVEIMVALGLAQGIVDLVETGDSLRDNNLRIFSEIGNYEATLICHPDVVEDTRLQQIKRRIEGVLVAQQYSSLEYNIPKELLPEAEKITPGFNAPTISSLDNEDWLAVKVMVRKKDIIHVMDQLEELGATAIMETEILNCRL